MSSDAKYMEALVKKSARSIVDSFQRVVRRHNTC